MDDGPRPIQDEYDDVAKACEVAETGAMEAWNLRDLDPAEKAECDLPQVDQRPMGEIVQSIRQRYGSIEPGIVGRAVVFRGLQETPTSDLLSVCVLECLEYRLVYVY